jgi:truncated hemoglobin YjbI
VQVLLPNRPDKMTRWWRDHLPAPFVTSRGVDDDLLLALPAPVDRAMVQGLALARTGFRNDTLSTRPLLQANDADVELLPGAPTPFVSDAAGRPLAWGVPAVDGLDRMRGVFVAVGGRSPRTAFIEQPDSVRWSSLLDRLQRVADSARISRGRRQPRRGRVQAIPTSTGTLLVQSFYEWIPDRAPSLTGIVALQGGRARTAMSLSAAFGAPAHATGGDDHLRLRIARIYAALQDALRRADWTAFGRAMAELRQLTVDR